MNFLAWFDIPANLLDLVYRLINGLFYLIAELIYPMISYLYDLFLTLTKGRLLDNEIMMELSNRIGLLLGIVMLFIVTISAIQMLVDPDKTNDKEKGIASIIKRVLIVIVMFGTSSFAFNTLYYVQKVVIDSQVVEKLLLPNEVSNVQDFGDTMAYTLFTTFYHVDSRLENNTNSEVTTCQDMIEKDLKETVYNSQDFSVAKSCLDKKIDYSGEEIYIVNFNWILMLGVGGFVIYFLFCYCISVGIRMVQLAFLEIISPMAFVSYLSPKKDNMFGKWIKMYSATFIDVFIRIAIINFAIFLIDLLLHDVSTWHFWDSLDGVSNFNFKEKTFIYIIMIIAILSFAKKAPELLKDLFPSGASKLKLGASMKDFVGLGSMLAGTAAFGIGVAGRVPGVISDVKNTQNGKVGAVFKGLGAIGTGAVGGVVRGAVTGNGKTGLGALKAGQQAQAKANLARIQRIASGKGSIETMQDGVYGFLGVPSANKGLDSALSMSNGIKTILEGEDPIKRFDKAYEDYRQACATKGIIANTKLWDDKRKELLAAMYEHGYKHDSNAVPLTINIKGLYNADGSDYTFNDVFESNMGIYQNIHVNEKRSGKDLSKYKAYKDDNNELKTKIAKTRKNNS